MASWLALAHFPAVADSPWLYFATEKKNAEFVIKLQSNKISGLKYESADIQRTCLQFHSDLNNAVCMGGGVRRISPHVFFFFFCIENIFPLRFGGIFLPSPLRGRSSEREEDGKLPGGELMDQNYRRRKVWTRADKIAFSSLFLSLLHPFPLPRFLRSLPSSSYSGRVSAKRRQRNPSVTPALSATHNLHPSLFAAVPVLDGVIN